MRTGSERSRICKPVHAYASESRVGANKGERINTVEKSGAEWSGSSVQAARAETS